ncbi:G patch domain-containing protein 4 [Hylaeus anthracinus]|uniref:G patch domain-containing protein 4 n=1 Tax=Hylaeus anthracinus TaxID=313031 RepID=UPI0023B9328E|nr:G patch domain-containing protein 4 [Hylaeus anthracinus]
MTDFAKSQLMKYGWTEGKGLGKNESGITQALKPKLKFDTVGIGHTDKHSKEWWEIGFNNAANNIVVESQAHGVLIFASKDSTSENSKNDLKCKYVGDYKSFLKTSTLLDGNLIKEENSNVLEVNKIEKDITHISLTDEELFKACGGRTAHKGARHGLTLNGKLKRIAQQEEHLLGTNIRINMSDELQKHSSKFEKNNFVIDNNENTVSPTSSFPSEEQSISKVSKSTKKKNKRRINDLNHQLNILCNISDDNERNKNNSSDDTRASKISKLKRKKKKRKYVMSDDIQTVKIEQGDKKFDDVSFPVSQKLDKEMIMNETPEQINEHCLKESDDKSTHKKVRKKSKKKIDQDYKDKDIINTPTDLILDCSQGKKFKKTHKEDLNIQHSAEDEDINMYQSELQSEPSSLLYLKSPDTYFKKEADKLNARISKKKKAKLLKKERKKLDTITANLEAVSFNSEELTKKNYSKNKLDIIVQKIVETNIAKDKTKSLKKINKIKNHT